MNKKVFIMEHKKSPKKDTKPILEAMSEVLDIENEIVYFEEEKSEELEKYLLQNASHIISRIDTSILKDLDGYFDFLRRLYDSDIEVHTHPDTLINLDFKDILAKLKDTPLGEKSVCFYQNFEEFTQGFPLVLRDKKVRVLKRSFGFSGEDVYLVKFNDNQTVQCVDAFDNKKRLFSSIYDFLKYFEPKFQSECKNSAYAKDKAGFVSCKYLPRINEGEIRVLLVRDRAVGVIRKVPVKEEFSTTIISGATHHFESPMLEKWRDIVEFTLDGLDYLEEFCKNKEFPILWTMDYILDRDLKRNDIYILSEINCSCVDISNELKYATQIAESFE